MVGAVVENVSNRKLFALLGCLVCAQIVFFLLGGLIAPQPSSSMEFLMSKCLDGSLGSDNKWFYIRPRGHCDEIHFIETDDSHPETPIYVPKTGDIREVVFVAQMPHVRDNVVLQYSPWFQSLLGLLIVETHQYEQYAESWPEILLEIRMAHKTKADGDWTEFVDTRVTRKLDCSYNAQMNGGCSPIELFELGSNDYPFYLLNIRVPGCNRTKGLANCELGSLRDLRVVAIHQNGGFTQVWLAIKTLLAPCMLISVIWFVGRVRGLPRRALLLEKCLVALGVVMFVVDVPVEWMSLVCRMPFMLLLSDIRQGVFYAVLFSFWLIFVGEHQTDDSGKNQLSFYWKHLAAVFSACICLFVFDMCERGVHLTNPFYSIWATDFGTNLAYVFIIVAAISAVVYFFFLTFAIGRVISSIKQKRASLNTMNTNRRIKFQGIIYRFKFLMVLTLVCAGCTVAGFMMDQIGDGQLRWGDYEDSPSLNYSSAFLTGMLGMWNIYVLLLLAMYAPSHKQYTQANRIANDEDSNSNSDEVQASYNVATDSAVLTSLIKPAND